MMRDIILRVYLQYEVGPVLYRVYGQLGGNPAYTYQWCGFLNITDVGLFLWRYKKPAQNMLSRKKFVQGNMFSDFYGSLQDQNYDEKNPPGINRIGWDIAVRVF